MSQCEVLIAHQTGGKHDRTAIKDWIEANADAAQLDDFMRNLVALQKGEVWAWSPSWLRIMQKVKIRYRKTFDSSATPEPGQSRPEPKKLAKIDLKKLESRMSESIEKAKADDPNELKKRIAELQKQLAKNQKSVSGDAIEKAIAERDRHWIKETSKLETQIEDTRTRLLSNVAKLADDIAKVKVSKPKTVATTVRASSERPHSVQQDQDSNDDGLRPAHMRILNALAWLESIGQNGHPRGNVAAIAGVSPKSSSFTNDVGRLRTLELVHYPAKGFIELTEAGRERAELPDSILSLEDLHEAWRRCGALRPAHIRIIDVVIENYPEPLTREQLADECGASIHSSSYSNDLGRLRSFGLIDYPAKGQVVGTRLLFPEYWID